MLAANYGEQNQISANVLVPYTSDGGTLNKTKAEMLPHLLVNLLQVVATETSAIKSAIASCQSQRWYCARSTT